MSSGGAAVSTLNILRRGLFAVSGLVRAVAGHGREQDLPGLGKFVADEARREQKTARIIARIM